MDSVRCDVGEVLDLSGSGMRLRTASKPPIAEGQVARLNLKFAGKKANLQVQARWIKRCGLKQFEVGLKFVNVTPKVQAIIDSVARYGFYCKEGLEGEAPAAPGKRESPRRVAATLDLPDYYKTLDVSRRADAKQVRSAFHRLAQMYHPDHNQSEDAPARFMEIKQAYDVLIDPDKRGHYDLLLKAG